eukprot:Rmarinus@m.17301
MMSKYQVGISTSILFLFVGQVLFLVGFDRYMKETSDSARFTSYYLASILNTLNVFFVIVAVLTEKVRWFNCLFLLTSLVSLVATGGVLNEQGHEVDEADNWADQCEYEEWSHPGFCQNIRLMFSGSFIYSFVLVILLVVTFGWAGGSGAWQGAPVPLDDDEEMSFGVIRDDEAMGGMELRERAREDRRGDDVI